MKTDKYLLFLSNIGKNKPNTFIKKDDECPFCHREKLTDIIEEEGPYLFLKNKYPTLKDTDQFVLVETYECGFNMNEYSDTYLEELFSFGIKYWFKLEKSNKYRSVIFYKNYGPQSGGSIKHAHMQIVGLKNMDFYQNIEKENFSGVTVIAKDDFELNISTYPLSGFNEFNVIMNDNLKDLSIFSNSILKVIKFILNDYLVVCNSYNLFFYHYDKKVICKIKPRFVTSPLLIGYCINQKLDNADKIRNKLKEKYFK
ncbi:DUF4931 domain-containing protein [Clostridium sp. BJN0001]|uniref:DUF4931 domain-containing protein n=1 Tax=Clostridium sp. BJN0001 TaxID=2930219 RepID=UPI001FD508EB|nr:DUF4931 domain-containing protein [Clostridium sp. BJN0001]